MELNMSFIEKFNSNSITGTTMTAAFTPGTPDQLYFSIDGNLDANARYLLEFVRQKLE